MRAVAATCALVAAAAAAGCHTPGQPPPPPLGFALEQHFGGHVGAGRAAGRVLYQYDFAPDSAALTARGAERLAALAAGPTPLIIEQTPDRPPLAEARRACVLALLNADPASVVVARPPAPGLSGSDALIVGQNLQLQTLTGGTQAVIGGGYTGGPIGLGSATGAGQAAGSRNQGASSKP